MYNTNIKACKDRNTRIQNVKVMKHGVQRKKEGWVGIVVRKKGLLQVC